MEMCSSSASRSGHGSSGGHSTRGDDLVRERTTTRVRSLNRMPISDRREPVPRRAAPNVPAGAEAERSSTNPFLARTFVVEARQRQARAALRPSPPPSYRTEVDQPTGEGHLPLWGKTCNNPIFVDFW